MAGKKVSRKRSTDDISTLLDSYGSDYDNSANPVTPSTASLKEKNIEVVGVDSGKKGNRVPYFIQERFDEWKEIDRILKAKERQEDIKQLPMPVSVGIKIEDFYGSGNIKNLKVSVDGSVKIIPEKDFLKILRSAIPLEGGLIKIKKPGTKKIKAGLKKKKKGQISIGSPVTPSPPDNYGKTPNEGIDYKFESPVGKRTSSTSPKGSSGGSVHYSPLRGGVSKSLEKLPIPLEIIESMERRLKKKPVTQMKLKRPGRDKLGRRVKQSGSPRIRQEVEYYKSLSPSPKKKSPKPYTKAKQKKIREGAEFRAEIMRGKGYEWVDGAWELKLENKQTPEKKKKKKGIEGIIENQGKALYVKKIKCAKMELGFDEKNKPVICGKSGRFISVNGQTGKKLLKERKNLVQEALKNAKNSGLINTTEIKQYVFAHVGITPTTEEMLPDRS